MNGRYVVHLDLYDTTLRDGTQQQGVSPTVTDKLRIAAMLDNVGVAYIEGGWPGANPKDTEFFRQAAAGELELKRATLTAFGMTRRPNADADTDPTLRALVEAGTSTVCLVGKSWDLHVREAVGASLDEGIRMVAESVAFLRDAGRQVFFDAEHFFDGYFADRSFALEVATAAAEAGAACVVLCDTNGGALPEQVERVVADVVGAIGGTQVGIHAHNDTDCAVASSMAAVRAGATHVQGTANGIGERCGNANLMSLIPNLQLKLGIPVVESSDLAHLTHVAHEVAEVLNLTTDPHAPYVGHAAFAHKAGLHVSALVKRADTYQHIEPSLVGNDLRLLVSELAGRATVVLKGAEFGVPLTDQDATRILQRVKELEHVGYTFEAADASFELLVRAETGHRVPRFRLESFRTIVERREDGAVIAEATVKLWIDEERLIGTGEGNGPVDALDHAFRAAIGQRLDGLESLHLEDYKVRILDAGSGTGATTRVLIRSTDGTREWDTVGVSPNVIEASWLALSDAYDYALMETVPGDA